MADVIPTSGTRPPLNGTSPQFHRSQKSDTWFGRKVEIVNDKWEALLDKIWNCILAFLIYIGLRSNTPPSTRTTLFTSPLMTTEVFEGGSFTWRVRKLNAIEIVSFTANDDNACLAGVERAFNLSTDHQIMERAYRMQGVSIIPPEVNHEVPLKGQLGFRGNVIIKVESSQIESFAKLGFQATGTPNEMFLDEWAIEFWVKIAEAGSAEERAPHIETLQKRPADKRISTDVQIVNHEKYTLKYRLDPANSCVAIVEIIADAMYKGFAIEVSYRISKEQGFGGHIKFCVPAKDCLEYHEWGFVPDKEGETVLESIQASLNAFMTSLQLSMMGGQTISQQDARGRIEKESERLAAGKMVSCVLHSECFAMWNDILAAEELPKKQQVYGRLSKWSRTLLEKKQQEAIEKELSEMFGGQVPPGEMQKMQAMMNGDMSGLSAEESQMMQQMMGGQLPPEMQQAFAAMSGNSSQMPSEADMQAMLQMMAGGHGGHSHGVGAEQPEESMQQFQAQMLQAQGLELDQVNRYLVIKQVELEHLKRKIEQAFGVSLMFGMPGRIKIEVSSDKADELLVLGFVPDKTAQARSDGTAVFVISEDAVLFWQPIIQADNSNERDLAYIKLGLQMAPAFGWAFDGPEGLIINAADLARLRVQTERVFALSVVNKKSGKIKIEIPENSVDEMGMLMLGFIPDETAEERCDGKVVYVLAEWAKPIWTSIIYAESSKIKALGYETFGQAYADYLERLGHDE